MDKQKLLIALFALMVLAQLAVPANMIRESRSLLQNGAEYKFKLRPIDPTDYFRGKYITLSFANSPIPVEHPEEWETITEAYALVSTDADGFAQISELLREAPTTTSDYIQVAVYGSYDSTLSYTFPFERYYMEEGKAALAEDLYRRFSQDGSQYMYAQVRVQDGKAVIQDILFNGTSINDYLDRTNRPELEDRQGLETEPEILEEAPRTEPDTLVIEAAH